MNQREALITVIDAVREQFPEPEKRLARALKLLEMRAEVLRDRADRRAHKRSCPCGERECLGVVCWECFHAAGAEMQQMWKLAKTDEDKRIAARGLIRKAIQRREARDL